MGTSMSIDMWTGVLKLGSGGNPQIFDGEDCVFLITAVQKRRFFISTRPKRSREKNVKGGGFKR